MKPQTQAVLRLLREKPEGITAIDALSAVGSFRLAARIWELRQAGYTIKSTPLRTSTGKTVDRYVLEEQLTLDGVA
jgi:hypothetical protein